MFLSRFAAPSGLSGLQDNFLELRHSEVRRISLPGTSMNRAASVSVYKGRHLFGARKRKTKVLGQSPSPELRKRLTSKDTYTTAPRSENGQVAKITYGVNFGEFPSTHSA
jgi:hypothetical protein